MRLVQGRPTEYPTPGQSVARKRVWGDFSTGGSRGIRTQQEYVRKGGATARVMLIQAAANEWKVPASERCVLSGANVLDATSTQPRRHQQQRTVDRSFERHRLRRGAGLARERAQFLRDGSDAIGERAMESRFELALRTSARARNARVLSTWLRIAESG